MKTNCSDCGRVFQMEEMKPIGAPGYQRWYCPKCLKPKKRKPMRAVVTAEIEEVAATMWAARADVNAAGLKWPPQPAWAELHRKLALVAIVTLDRMRGTTDA